MESSPVQSSAARLLEVLSLLQARPQWNAVELAERLGITERTVRRDMAKLRDLGYPVEADPGRSGGYRLGIGRALPPLLLTDDEAVAVAVGLRAAASTGVTGYEEAAVAALTKLEQVMPLPLRETVLALNASTVMVRPGPGELVDPDVLVVLAQGCRRHERVAFSYTDGAGQVSERRAEPYGLVHAARRWYLVARDLDRADWRTFRVDRIDSPVLTGHRFVPDGEPDVAAMVVQGIARAPYDWQAEVVLHTTLDEALTEIAPTIATLESFGGSTVMRIGANDIDWIARYLAGLPFRFEIRHPAELRAAVHRLAERLLEL
jgi:predicted DNA-binding transcriptional regulator YafY